MAAESEEDSYMWMDDDPGPAKKSCTADKKRRFSDDQVKSLELMFESQAKLEPRKKLQLAKDLGLHPRQVAIWFQNKRARWKSKQLEREYNTLKSDYDALLSNFESLKNEKQALTKQLHRLVELLNKPGEERRTEDETPSTESEERSDVRLMMCLNDNDEENRYGGTPRFREKESDLYPVEDDSTLVPSEHQFWPSEQPGAATSQWWDFWPLNG